MGRRASVAFAVIVAGVFASGCGGGGDEETARAGERGRTEAQWAKAATAVCREQRRRIATELDSFAEARGSGGATLAPRAMKSVIIPGFRRQYEALREIWPPQGDEDFLDLMLSKFSRSLENGEEELRQLFRVKLSGYSEFAEGTLMTEEYGVKGCGSLGRSPQAVYRQLTS